MPIQACLIDIGNVLVTFDYQLTFRALADRSTHSYEQIQAHLSSHAEELETGRLSTAGFIQSAIGFIGGGVTEGEFRTAFTEIFTPLAPVWEMLAEVRRKAPLYLFSNTSELHETWLTGKYPEFSLFDGGFFSWRLGVMKPHEPFYQAALDSLNLAAEDIAYVDDLPPNIATGQRLGMNCHLFDHRRPEALREFFGSRGLL